MSSTLGSALVEARTHAYGFVSLRRNVVVVGSLAVLGVLQTALVAVPVAGLVQQGTLDASAGDLLGLVLRNQVLTGVLGGVVGLAATASDRRSGLLGARVTAWGRRPALQVGLWLFALVTACVAAVPGSLVPLLVVSWVHPDGGSLDPSRLVVLVPLTACALLHHVAWGVICGCVTNRYWLQLALLVAVPWFAVPVVRGALITQDGLLWLTVLQLLPFESAATLTAWSGSANALTGLPARSPAVPLLGCLALVVLAVGVHDRRTRHGRVDP